MFAGSIADAQISLDLLKGCCRAFWIPASVWIVFDLTFPLMSAWISVNLTKTYLYPQPWTKGSMDLGLVIFLSFHPSFGPKVFLKSTNLPLLELRMVLGAHVGLCLTARSFGKNIFWDFLVELRHGIHLKC